MADPANVQLKRRIADIAELKKRIAAMEQQLVTARMSLVHINNIVQDCADVPVSAIRPQLQTAINIALNTKKINHFCGD